MVSIVKQFSLLVISTLFLATCGYGRRIRETNCHLSSNTFDGIDKSSILLKCDPLSPDFCPSCLCGLSEDIVNAVNMSSLCQGSSFNGELSEHRNDYLFYLVQNRILTDTVFSSLNNCTNFNPESCNSSASINAQIKYNTIRSDDSSKNSSTDNNVDFNTSGHMEFSPSPPFILDQSSTAITDLDGDGDVGQDVDGDGDFITVSPSPSPMQSGSNVVKGTIGSAIIGMTLLVALI